MSRELFLYTRANCELCQVMHAELQDVIQSKHVSVHLVDIDNDADLVHRYGARIPVLVAGKHEICEVKLDRDALEAFLSTK